MMNMKYLLASIITVGLNLSPTMVYAQQFNGAVSNPFSLCEAPKPCKQCQPMRAHWEQLCPNQNNAKANNIEVEPPQEQVQPVINNQPATNQQMSNDEIKAEIAKLRPIWTRLGEISMAARVVVEDCVARTGRVQDGFCAAEMADYNAKRLPAGEYREEIYRLEALLR